MPIFKAHTDVQSLYQQLRFDIYKIIEGLESKNPTKSHDLSILFDNLPKEIQYKNEYFEFAGIGFKLRPQSKQLTYLDIHEKNERDFDVYSALISRLSTRMKENQEGVNSSEPHYRTKKRFDVFKRLKEEHPDWTQTTVANEASDILGEICTADTVRNAYREIGVSWVRGDRTRR